MPKPSGKSPERKLQVVLAVLRGEQRCRQQHHRELGDSTIARTYSRHR